MNILFEIADRDLILFGLIFSVVVLFGIIIFFAVNKNRIVFTEEVEEEKPELTEEQRKAKEELERVFNQMSADLESKNNKEEMVETFEREQEENAIISYQELIKQAEEKVEDKITPIQESELKEEFPRFEEEFIDEFKEEPITAIEAEAHNSLQLELELESNEFNEAKKFKNSDIISPIFGIQKETKYKGKPKGKKTDFKEEPFVARHAYENIERTYEEDGNKDFLNSLKEFRKNL